MNANQPTARLSEKLYCNRIIVLVTMATPISSHVKDKNSFIDYLNNIHSTIKFTISHSSTNIPFLDVNVSLTNDGNISTDLYTKPTDKHQHYSIHPAILYIQKKPFLSVLHSVYDAVICSTDATFLTRTAQLATYLLKRGYNRNFVKKQIRRAADIPANALYKPKTSLTNPNEYNS